VIEARRLAESDGQRWLMVAATGLLLIAILGAFAASRRQGQDFASLQLTAVGLATRAPLYDPQWLRTVYPIRYGLGAPQGVFYPPATGVVMLPFAPLPFRVAQVAWLAVMIVSIVVGVRALVRLARPESSRTSWVLAAAVVLLSACVRWGTTPLQGAPLVLGLLCLFVQAIHLNRWGIAYAIAALVLAFKFTLALPFLGLLLLHRRYGGLAFALFAAVALNVAGFAWLGGRSVFEAYRQNIAFVEAFGDINTPDPWDPVSVPRLDWAYLFYGVSRNIAGARLLTMLASAGTLLWLCWEGFKVRNRLTLQTTIAFLTPLACLGMLSVYHHHYDASLLAAPFLLVVLLSPSALSRSKWAVAMAFPLVFMMALLPIAVTQSLCRSVLGSNGTAIMNLAFPVAMTLTLLGALVVLRNTVGTGRAILFRREAT